MNSTMRRITVPLFFFLLVSSFPLAAQQQPAAEEVIAPEEFTNFLKQVWSFVKAETEGYLNSTASRAEFETAGEFERRVNDTRQRFVANLIKYSRDQQLDQRTFSVLFKTRLDSYDADKQLYSISSVTVVEAPYNIPTVLCTMRKNPYVFLADSIRSGYRTSSIYINLPKGQRWQVARDLAKATKADEDNIYFRVKLMVNIENPDLKQQRAVLELVPKEFALVNNATNKVFWAVPIR